MSAPSAAIVCKGSAPGAISDDAARSEAARIAPLPRLFPAPLPGSDVPLMADSIGALPEIFLFGSTSLSPSLAVADECASAIRATPTGVGIGVEDFLISAVVAAAGFGSGCGSLAPPPWTAATASDPDRTSLAGSDPGTVS